MNQEPMIPIEEIIASHEYFLNLRGYLCSGKPKPQIDLKSPPEADIFRRNLSVALKAAERLKEQYTPRALEFLANNGFNIEKTVILGVAQDVVITAARVAFQEDVYPSEDNFEQVRRVLSAYRTIAEYEEKAGELRKIMAIEEARKMSKQ